MIGLHTGNGDNKHLENTYPNTFTMVYPSEIEISVRKISFVGFDNFDTKIIGEIIREKLLSILLNHEYPIRKRNGQNGQSTNLTFEKTSGKDISRIDGGTFSLKPQLDVLTLGNETAKSIAKALTTAAADNAPC